MTRIFVSAALAVVLNLFVMPFTLAGIEELDEDFDGDGIINRSDNCYLFSNPLQGDTDGDGFGNFCDTDLNNDLTLDFKDLALFREKFLSNDALADFNEDGTVNFLDLSIFRSRFTSGQPGPAIVVRWAGGTGQWDNPFNWIPNALPSQNFVHAEIAGVNDLIEVPEGYVARAKTLVLRGAVDLCGDLRVNQDFIVTGQINMSCPTAVISAFNGLDLGGEIQLQDGGMQLSEVRKITDTNPVIRILEAPNTEVGSLDFLVDFRSEVNIEVLPGGNLILPNDLVLTDASLTLISEVDRPGSVFMSDDAVISGSGTLVFAGPDDSRATGVVFQGLLDLELGPDITVSLEPGAHGFFRTGTTTFLGDVEISEGATLYFPKFGVTVNNGSMTCSTGGAIFEQSPGGSSQGDSVLINNASGSVVVDQCDTDWPTRVVNQGTYSVNASTVVFPLIGGGGQPLTIEQSDVTIEVNQAPLPADFYLLSGDTQNTFFHSGFLDLGGEVLDIDASKWTFDELQFSFGSVLLNGTLRSDTPLNVNTNGHLRLESMLVEPEIHIETGGTLVIDQMVSVNQNLSFVEPSVCDDPQTVEPGVLEFRSQFSSIGDSVRILADGSNDNDLQPCLKGEILSAVPQELSLGMTIEVTDAEMALRSETASGIRVNGLAMVNGNAGFLNMQHVINSGTIACEAGAALALSGSASLPFTNLALIDADNCDVTFSNHWRNDSNVTLTRGSLSLLGPGGFLIDFGEGNFISELTDITFDLFLNDLSVLDVFKPIPPGGTFTLTSSLDFIGPTLNTSDLPFNTQFGDGFELSNKVISGAQPLRLTGDAQLTDIETSANVEVSNSAVVTLSGAFELNNTDLLVSANNAESTTVLIDNTNNVNLAGNGRVVFDANGNDAMTSLLGTSSGSITVSPDISVNCAGAGRCLAGAGSGMFTVGGDLTVSDTGTRFEALSDLDLNGTTSLLERAQLLGDNVALAFSGPNAALAIELFNDTGSSAAVVAGDSPGSSLSIGDAALSFTAGAGFTLADAGEVFVLEHAGEAMRLGEFADVSGAVIDGVMLAPDYSSPDVTIFRAPPMAAPALTRQ